MQNLQAPVLIPFIILSNTFYRFVLFISKVKIQLVGPVFHFLKTILIFRGKMERENHDLIKEKIKLEQKEKRETNLQMLSSAANLIGTGVFSVLLFELFIRFGHKP